MSDLHQLLPRHTESPPSCCFWASPPRHSPERFSRTSCLPVAAQTWLVPPGVTHLVRLRAKGGTQLCSPHSSSGFSPLTHGCSGTTPVGPQDQWSRGPASKSAHKKVKVTQKGLSPRSLKKFFFDFSTFQKGQVNDDFRTERSRENWKEEQSPLGWGEGEKAHGG